MVPTNLRDGRQIWHGLKVVSREVSAAPRPDTRKCLVDLCTQFLLAVAMLGQLPESEGQLENV